VKERGVKGGRGGVTRAGVGGWGGGRNVAGSAPGLPPRASQPGCGLVRTPSHPEPPVMSRRFGAVPGRPLVRPGGWAASSRPPRAATAPWARCGGGTLRRSCRRQPCGRDLCACKAPQATAQGMPGRRRALNPPPVEAAAQTPRARLSLSVGAAGCGGAAPVNGQGGRTWGGGGWPQGAFSAGTLKSAAVTHTPPARRRCSLGLGPPKGRGALPINGTAVAPQRWGCLQRDILRRQTWWRQ
jgi:hypothetical protein